MNRDAKAWAAGIIGVGALLAYIVIPSVIPEPSSGRQKKYTTGLINTGNDCFANSTFQALAPLTGLRDFLLKEQDASKPWTCAMATVLEDLEQEDSAPRQSRIWPALRLIEQLYEARMSRGQQDAHELLMKILELLEREHSGSGSELPFRGTITDTIQCRRCGLTTSKNTEFVVLERHPSEEILKPQAELIEDYNCSECGPTVIEKTSRVSKVPRVLAVHINRSIYANASFRNSQAVNIPAQLGLLQELQLRSIVYHRGNHYRGHYTAARRQQGADKESALEQWWIISDDNVREGSTKQVLARNTEAYMMFYEVGPKPPLRRHSTTRATTETGEKSRV